jgi:hypothetical protein
VRFHKSSERFQDSICAGPLRAPYMRTSYNSVKRKSNFAEFTFHALR